MNDRIKLKTDKRGRQIASAQLRPGEHLMIVETHKFYLLGAQLDQVVPGHVITEMLHVTWCHFDQKWVTP